MIFNVLFLIGRFRVQRLLQEIMGDGQNKTIIFVETKRKADELTRMMKRDGYVSLILYNFTHQ